MMTMVISGSDGVTFPDSTTQNTTDRYGFVNRIINGDMRIDQRNAGAAVTTSGAYPVDRFIMGNFTDGAFSAQQDSSAPDGFVNSLKITTTTADGTLTTTQALQLIQRIEGTNVSDLAWGTASAKTVTLSFWVRSSLTGTFGGALRNNGGNRSYPFTYSISSADTWEYKTVTVAGDTSGTWLTTTGIGVIVSWGLGVGPDSSGTAGAWNANNNTSATGAVSVIGTLNATWYVTGVQLEVGSVATPFERRPYTTELQLCQRYFQTLGGFGSDTFCFLFLAAARGTGSAEARGLVVFPVRMRTTPSISTSGNFRITDDHTNVTAVSTLAINQASSSVAGVLATGTGNLSWAGTNQAVLVSANNDANANVRFSSEL
jgi:hypothetical protein